MNYQKSIIGNYICIFRFNFKILGEILEYDKILMRSIFGFNILILNLKITELD